MKKVLIPLALVSIAVVFYFQNSDKNEELYKTIKKSYKKPAIKKLRKQKVTKEAPTTIKKTQKHQDIDINSMYPCEALSVLSKHKEPWTFLAQSNQQLLYVEAHKTLEIIFDDKSLSSMQKSKIYGIMDKFSNTQYIPYLEDIYLKAKTANKNQKLIDKIKSRLLYTYDAQDTLVSKLSQAKYLFEEGNMADSIFLLNSIAEDPTLLRSDVLETLRIQMYNNASTPSEISAAIETVSRVPTYNFTFLLELKKKHSSKGVDKILDKVALKLINRTLSTKSALDVDYLSYEVALSLHSKGELIKQRYGSREEIVKKFINKDSIDNSQACDDREIIDLCTKYCKR